MSDLYDVIVIGAGPAGYPAAIRAAQNKLKVACVDEWQNTDGSFAFGGTCLNAGCIPSKALLESSELYQRAKEEFSVHGINIGQLTLDLAAMQKRRAAVVKTMTGGITALFKANGVTGIQAGSAERKTAVGVLPLVDAGDFELVLRGANRGRIARGTAADHDDIVEIAHTPSTMRAGSSRHCLTVTKNCTASRPSMMR